MAKKKTPVNIRPKILRKELIFFFFLLGVIGAFSFRIIVLLEHFDASLVRPVWYIGILSYIVFFGYRYYISDKRKQAIKDFDLCNSIKDSNLKPDAKQVSVYILGSLEKSREHLNYLFIFILSVIVIIIDIILSLL